MAMAVVDFAKLEGESAFIKKALTKFGINLDIGQAIAQLAGTIRDHNHFQRLITETEPAMRHSFYDSVRPHLKFRAKPLDVYIAEAGQMAEREQLPMLMPDGTLQEFRPAQDVSSAQKEIAKSVAARNLTLNCTLCTREETFYCVGNETPVTVIMKARKAGWIYNPVSMSEHCPTCMSARTDA